MVESIIEKTNLFTRKKYGYNNYRIPALAVTSKGTLLAACEARKKRSDWACRAIMLRRSEDNGSTWSKQIPLVKSEDKNWKKHPETALNNPVFIIDNEKSIIHFLYCQHYEKAYYMQSKDDGKTFTDPVEITSAFEPFRQKYNWKVIATGPGKGIHTKSGVLLVPIWIAYGSGHQHRPSVCGVIYSENDGQDWKAGELIPVNKTENIPNGSESYMVQLHDGSVYFNFRNTSSKRQRACSLSQNGIDGWSNPEFVEALFEPICMASLVRYTEEGVNNKQGNRILFSNPDSSNIPDPTRRMRKNLTIKMSYDECKTWEVSKLLESRKSGYSDLAIGKDGMIYCLYERGGKKRRHPYYHHIACAKFNLEWLTEGKDSLQ